MSATHHPHSDDDVAAAGLCGDLRVTEHVFGQRSRRADRHLFRQVPRGDFDTDNLLENLPWLVTETARRAARAGKPITADQAFLEAANELLDGGPQDITQLPTTLSKKARKQIAAGNDPRKVLTREWRRQVREAFVEAWEPWRAVLETRARVQHPLVRIVLVNRMPDHLTKYGTLLGYDPIVVTGADGLTASSALVHPAEAEDLLDDVEKDAANVRLLPSPGVSQERIDTALRLRSRRAYREDPPLRSLAAALVAAADVLNEPVFGAPVEVSEEQARVAMTALLPAPPPPPAPKPRGKQQTYRFAIAA